MDLVKVNWTPLVLTGVALVVAAISLALKASPDPDVVRIGGTLGAVGILVGGAALVVYGIQREIERDRDRRM
ncbi:hypothetical protein [Nonomuraea harbinensis]|uniref:DUF2530 domain-containing protein n=1 Tax=Nonomuraea harbinensis TaxID=1286938 RepID=A0ABW1BNZ2_9ACTN|nr:hypothetical protein [Nonomuraea harbinensis]